VVDAFKGYNLEKKETPVSLRDFITQLSLELIISGKNKEEAKVEQEEETFDENPNISSYHTPSKRRRTNSGRKRKQKRSRCSECKYQTSTYCDDCGKAIHAPRDRLGTVRPCYRKDRQKHHFD
jgi:hypothetical protein